MPPRRSLPSAGPSSTPRGRGRPSTSATASASKSTPSRLHHPGKRPRTSRGGARAPVDLTTTEDDFSYGNGEAISPLTSPSRQSHLKTEDGQQAEHANGATASQAEGAIDGAQPGAEAAVEIDPEAELEAWQDFAHEHYEMVEQLPLELHRNFRLLRELDDGCIAQIDKLHSLVRRYAKERLALEDALVPKQADVVDKAGPEPPSTLPPTSTQTQELRDPTREENDKGEVERTSNKTATATEIEPSRPTGGAETGESDRPEYASKIKGDEVPIAESDREAEIGKGTQQVPGVPIPDGQGGLFIHVDPAATHDVVGPSNPPRKGFPAIPLTLEINGSSSGTHDRQGPNSTRQELELSTGESNDGVAIQQHEGRNQNSNGPPASESAAQATTSASAIADVGPETSTKKRKRGDGPHKHLPEIARLAREVVRTAEEKVAVAVGAYNAIDRHIRALDSALTAQEASILLGLRPSTLPSANVDDSLNLAGDLAIAGANTNGNTNTDLQGGFSGQGVSQTTGAGVGDGDDEEMVLGLGGGGARRSNQRKQKKGKKGKKASAANHDEEQARQLELEAQQAQGVFSIPADPNEPRYCYCNQVSYGQMVGCDNDECPIEWFHIACTGLQQPPTGKWYCTICQPKMGLAKGGAGRVAPKNVGAGAVPGRRKK
ncbi:hypothetical protein IAU59_002129 [Kwoniella sp. CBS 9459]